MGKNNAYIPNLQAFIDLGLDPKTGLPIKFRDPNANPVSVDDIQRALRIVDEQDAVRRYKWYNLPDDIDGELVERMLYYRGTVGFFYVPELDKFFILPYTMEASDGQGIDCYSRITRAKFMPFGADYVKTEKKSGSELFLEAVGPRDVQYSMYLEETNLDVMSKKCVLLFDYVKQLSNVIIPRQLINDPILRLEAELLPLLRTALMLSTGATGVKVPDADAVAEVNSVSKKMMNAALKGEPYVPIGSAGLDFQELAPGAVSKAEEYLMSMQSIDNFRLGLYGLENGGLFEKKAHELQTEADMNSNNVGLVMQDGLSLRQHFCDVVNSIWGLGIWVEPSEAISGDTNRDGVAYDYDNSDGGETDEGGADDAE